MWVQVHGNDQPRTPTDAPALVEPRLAGAGSTNPATTRGNDMKVRINATLDIPAEGVEAWLLEYGCDREEIREDIRTYVRTMLQECTGAHVAQWELRD
jgi:hypothetical protein